MLMIEDEKEKPDLTDVVQKELLSLAEMVADGDLSQQDTLAAIRLLKKKRASKVKSVRSLVEEGIGEEKYRSVETLFKEVRSTHNEFLAKYAIFVSVEGKPDDNMPKFVLRFVRPVSRGYADTLNPLSSTHGFAGETEQGRSFVIAEHKTSRIDHTIEEMENFFKWILSRWEKKK